MERTVYSINLYQEHNIAVNMLSLFILILLLDFMINTSAFPLCILFGNLFTREFNDKLRKQKLNFL